MSVTRRKAIACPGFWSEPGLKPPTKHFTSELSVLEQNFSAGIDLILSVARAIIKQTSTHVMPCQVFSQVMAGEETRIGQLMGTLAF